MSIIAAQPMHKPQTSASSKWARFSFLPAFVLTYVLMLQVLEPLIPQELVAKNHTPGVADLSLLLFVIEMRVILIVVFFILCLPFVPAVQKWKAFLAGALTALFTSALDFQFWKFGLNRFDESWFAAIGFPAIAFALATWLIQYAWNRLGPKHAR